MASEHPVVGGVDWGGTWIRAALVADGRIVHRGRVARPAGVPEQYQAIAELLRQCAAATGQTPAAVGVGVAGIVQGDRVMTAINLGITSATEVGRCLGDALGIPVFVINDTQAAAV